MTQKHTDIREHDPVVLQRDIPELQLTRGDIGTAVGLYADGEGFEVEFMTAQGRTIDVITLERADIRLFRGNAILNAREVV